MKLKKFFQKRSKIESRDTKDVNYHERTEHLNDFIEKYGNLNDITLKNKKNLLLFSIIGISFRLIKVDYTELSSFGVKLREAKPEILAFLIFVITTYFLIVYFWSILNDHIYFFFKQNVEKVKHDLKIIEVDLKYILAFFVPVADSFPEKLIYNGKDFRSVMRRINALLLSHKRMSNFYLSSKGLSFVILDIFLPLSMYSIAILAIFNIFDFVSLLEPVLLYFR